VTVADMEHACVERAEGFGQCFHGRSAEHGIWRRARRLHRGTHSQAACCRHGRVTDRTLRHASSSTATGSRRSTLTSEGFNKNPRMTGNSWFTQSELTKQFSNPTCTLIARLAKIAVLDTTVSVHRSSTWFALPFRKCYAPSPPEDLP
jgi:hypothetical protein